MAAYGEREDGEIGNKKRKEGGATLPDRQNSHVAWGVRMKDSPQFHATAVVMAIIVTFLPGF